MYSFTLQFLIMSSLAAIIYLVARTVPRIDENVILGGEKKSFFDNLISKLPLEKIDLLINNLTEKLLRRIKIVIMKIDNVLTRKISSYKPSSSGKKDLRPNIFENPSRSISEEGVDRMIEKKE